MEEGRNVLTKDDIETVDVSKLEKREEGVRQDSDDCKTCGGTDGHHFGHCPEKNPKFAESEELAEPALEQNEVGDELPGKLDTEHGKPLSQDEIQGHFDKADELFEGKKFEDGAVVEEYVCPNCGVSEGAIHGTSCGDVNALQPGPHFVKKPRDFGAEQEAREEVHTPEEQLSHVKLPPSAQMLVGNELLWLIARTCHEVNRAYCVGVLSDHSHRPWDEAPSWQRESCYEGVTKHHENPEFTPEDSHRSWMGKKIADGWVFGNMKDETAKTHPNLVPYHTLHIHERTKDAIFSAICKSMLGGTRGTNA